MKAALSGLKPSFRSAADGTAKAVPFHNIPEAFARNCCPSTTSDLLRTAVSRHITKNPFAHHFLKITATAATIRAKPAR